MKIRRKSKDNLKQDKYFACNQIKKEERKSGAYEVTTRVETEDGCVTSTVQIICGYKLQQKV